uniref:non-specific serine/threonine protein kinase n=1 Tax=Plectus sambesii TaxID=2011161 RepID=A0A914XAN0_9BILA
MPPKKAAGAVAKRGKANAYRMAPIVPEGTILSDHKKHQFRLGKAFAQGGFGRIYTAKQIDTGSGAKKDTLVVKMEPAENGPLFQETHVYMRIAKPEMIEQWRKKNNVSFLGIPPYLSSGVQEIGGEKHRFLIMPRFGIDLESIRVREGGKLSAQIVFAASRACSDALRYLHDQNYVHADLKAENLLLAEFGGSKEDCSRVVLVDFGLAKRLNNPEFKEDKKRAHDGTCIFTSLDAHRGCVPSYRGDFEILAYNILYWLTGSLPWLKDGETPEKVQAKKQTFSTSVEGSVKKLVTGSFSKDLMELFDYVYLLDYTERPDYDFVNKLLDNGLKKARKESPVKPRASSQSRASSSPRKEVKAAVASPVKKAPSPVKKAPPPEKKVPPPARVKKVAKRISSTSSQSPSPERQRRPAPSKRLRVTADPSNNEAHSPDVVLSTPSPTDDRRTTASRRFIQKTPLHLARPAVRSSNGNHSPSNTSGSRILPGRANMQSGRHPHTGSVSSPSTAALSVIPGLANMRRVRRSVGASLVKKYIEKEQQKLRKKRPVVANGTAQTSPGMWEDAE